MNQDFAEFLRKRRQRVRLSQTELARRAQVSERTLRYWEKGQTSPGRWELDSLMIALELTPEERIQALELLPTRRGIHLSREEVNAFHQRAEVRGPLPDIGSILQAMRQRRGLTQEQLAAQLDLTRSTIARWESARALPSEDNLERIGMLLKAYPEERVVLSARRLQTWDGKPNLSLEECAEEADRLDRCGVGLLTPLVDLRALALKRRLWLLAGESDVALVLLARVQIIHGSWLMQHERKAEAELCIQRSLNILRGRVGRELFWQAAVNLAAHFAYERRGSAYAAAETLKSWLPRFPKETQSTLWCDMALYAGYAKQHDAAVAYLTQAQEVLPYSANEPELTIHYLPITKTRTLLSAKRLDETLQWLPPLPGAHETVTTRTLYHLIWAEVCLATGDKDTAQRMMDHLRVLLAEHPQPRNERKLAELSERL